MTHEEFEQLPIANNTVLWIDPGDPRCGFIMGEFGVEWTIGFDGPTLSRSHRYGGMTVPVVKPDGRTVVVDVSTMQEVVAFSVIHGKATPHATIQGAFDEVAASEETEP